MVLQREIQVRRRLLPGDTMANAVGMYGISPLALVWDDNGRSYVHAHTDCSVLGKYRESTRRHPVLLLYASLQHTVTCAGVRYIEVTWLCTIRHGR